MKKILYYFKKLKEKTASIFSIERIKQFGFKIAILDFLIFLCHRSASDFQLMLIREKDKIVQKYIYRNYKDIVEKYRGK